MLQNAYLLAKIGPDTAENEQHFSEIFPKTGNYPFVLVAMGMKHVAGLLVDHDRALGPAVRRRGHDLACHREFTAAAFHAALARHPLADLQDAVMITITDAAQKRFPFFHAHLRRKMISKRPRLLGPNKQTPKLYTCTQYNKIRTLCSRCASVAQQRTSL